MPETLIFNPYEYDRLILRERRPLPDRLFAQHDHLEPIDIFKPINPPLCGTEAGHMWHRRHEEPIDEDCRQALNAAKRRRAAEKKAADLDEWNQ